MKTIKERADVYRQITEQIIEAIEKGADQWEMPWHRSDTIPSNAATGKKYRGVNILSLWATASAKGYRSGIWATYAQWTELGSQVRKGEKSSCIVFWKFPDRSGDNEDAQPDEQPEEDRSKRGPIARGYGVFNADQVDGFVLPELPALPRPERIEAADRFFTALTMDLRHGGSRAFYNHAEDFVQLPPFEVFKENTAYYATLAHEAIHNAAPGIMPRREGKARELWAFRCGWSA